MPKALSIGMPNQSPAHCIWRENREVNLNCLQSNGRFAENLSALRNLSAFLRFGLMGGRVET